MIRDLDDTIKELLETKAPPGSLLAGADISFDLPDAKWRGGLSALTVNCYLYDIRENREMRTNELLSFKSADNKRAVRLAPPVRIDCGYCITAWSISTSEAVLEEHRLLSQVVRVLLRFPTIPASVLQGSLVTQIPPVSDGDRLARRRQEPAGVLERARPEAQTLAELRRHAGDAPRRHPCRRRHDSRRRDDDD